MNKSGVELIAEERKRQIEAEGWDAKHDEQHFQGNLVMASVCYCLDYYSNFDTEVTGEFRSYFHNLAREYFPWDQKWWKPTPNDPIRQLVKAGALIAAEVDRLQRLKEIDHVNSK